MISNHLVYWTVFNLHFFLANQISHIKIYNVKMYCPFSQTLFFIFPDLYCWYYLDRQFLDSLGILSIPKKASSTAPCIFCHNHQSTMIMWIFADLLFA